MASNNLGLAEFWLGEIGSARTHLSDAIRLDADYPLPYFNLALAASAEGKDAEARMLVEKAAILGYLNSASDQLFAAASALYAGVEGRGGG